MDLKLIKIGAEWCGGCKVLDSQLNHLSTDVEIVSLDMEKDYDEIHEYPVKIMNLPTLLVIDQNNEILHRWVGSVRTDEIDSKLKELSK